MFIAVVFLLVACTKAQKFREDYMWAHTIKTFYRLHDVATDWHQARQICEAEGTTLLVPANVEEMENLKVLISNMKAHFTGIFIGLHDQFSNGNYVNLTGYPIKGTHLEFLWGEGLPDNEDGQEHCAIMTREGLFDDKRCDAVYPFVCKILGDNVKYNEKCKNYDAGYEPLQGKCYKFHEEPLTWHDAYLICKAEEGHLVVINSPEEAALITKLLADHLTSSAPDPNILYIGFSDLMFPFHYRTINGQTLEEAGYSSWSPRIEDMSLTEPTPKNCGAISRTGFLQVVQCDRRAMFLCEKAITASDTDK